MNFARHLFRWVGFGGLALTWLSLGWLFWPLREPGHVAAVLLASAAATWGLGGWADRQHRHPLVLGGACALGVLASGVVAVIAANGPLAVSDPWSYVVRPAAAVTVAGLLPALVAGSACGLVVQVLRRRA